MSKNKPIEYRIVPVNFGFLINADRNARKTGFCGDTIEFWTKLEKGYIQYYKKK